MLPYCESLQAGTGRPDSTTASRFACGSTTATSAAATRSGSGSSAACRSASKIGPRDIAERHGDARPPRRRPARAADCRATEFVANDRRRRSPRSSKSLFDRAAKLPATTRRVKIDSPREFEKFFTPKNAERPRDPRRPGVLPLRRLARDGREAQGAEGDRPLRAARRARTSRASASSPGKPSTKRGVFAKAY